MPWLPFNSPRLRPAQGHGLSKSRGSTSQARKRVKGTKTACHLGRRVTAQPGSRRTASLPPRPPPRSALQKKRAAFPSSPQPTSRAKRDVSRQENPCVKTVQKRNFQKTQKRKNAFFSARTPVQNGQEPPPVPSFTCRSRTSRTKPHCLPMIQTCRASTLALHSQPVKVSGLWILLPSASQKRTFRESSLHFRNVAPCQSPPKQPTPLNLFPSQSRRSAKALGPYRSCWAPRQCWSTGTARRCASPHSSRLPTWLLGIKKYWSDERVGLRSRSLRPGTPGGGRPRGHARTEPAAMRARGGRQKKRDFCPQNPCHAQKTCQVQCTSLQNPGRVPTRFDVSSRPSHPWRCLKKLYPVKFSPHAF